MKIQIAKAHDADVVFVDNLVIFVAKEEETKDYEGIKFDLGLFSATILPVSSEYRRSKE